jgi:hypothetical protein
MVWGLASTITLFLIPNRESFCRDTRCFSTTSLQETAVEASKYKDMMTWLKSNGAEINEKLDIRQSSSGCGFGVYVSSEVAEDEVLFTVPRKACLTLDDATNDSNCGEAFSNIIDKAGPGGNTVAMAGYMAKEYLMFLEDVKKGTESSNQWGSYFQTLPWERGVNSQEHTLFWSDDMLESMLKGSLCYGEAIALREEVALATRIMGPIVGKSIRAARGIEEAFSWPWEVKEPEGPPDGLSDAMQGAFVCLLTRAFQDGEDGEDDAEKLVPMLDMLQHNDSPNVKHAMRNVDGTVEVRARCEIAAGAELFNQYRPEAEETMPYARFFTRFGFVPGITEPMENLLKDKSSIFYPMKAEV